MPSFTASAVGRLFQRSREHGLPAPYEFVNILVHALHRHARFSAAADVDVGAAENNGKGISRQRSRLVPLGWESFHAPSETSATQVAENEVGVLLVILKSRAPSPSPT